MRLPKDFFSYYPFGLPTHFASIVQRPDGFQIDRDCRRLMAVSYTHLVVFFLLGVLLIVVSIWGFVLKLK